MYYVLALFYCSLLPDMLHILCARLCYIVPCSQICCMYYELGFALLFPVAGYVACIMS